MNLTNQGRRLVCANVLLFLTLFSASAQIENTGSLNTWTTRPLSRAHNSSTHVAYVKVVRAAKHSDADRVVFEFAGPFPNYRIEYLKSHFYEGEGGRERIRSPGNVFLQVEFFLIPATDEQLKFTRSKKLHSER